MLRRIGLNLDGSCSHITIGRSEIPFISLNYGDSIDAEWVYRSGSQVAEADTPGQYKTEDGSIKLSGVNARTLLLPALAKFGAGNTRFSSIVTFTHPEIGTDSDALIGLRIMGDKQTVEASAAGLVCEFKIRYRKILWTAARICFGNEGGTGARGSARL